MKNFVVGLFAFVAAWLLPAPALAQSTCPTFSYGAVLTAAQWQACFDAKQNVLGYTPLNKAGDTMLGRLVTTAPGATTAGLNLTPGTTPSAPSNGDVWVTSAGMFVRVAGSTIGPLAGGSSASFAATSPLAVAFPASIVTYSITGLAGGVLAGSGPAFTRTPTLGASGTVGTLAFGNATSGTVTLGTVAGALGTVTLSLPAATDTLMGKATTDTMTGKTFDTAGSGNSFSIAGVAVTANSGTGSMVRATGPTISALVVTGSITATGLVTNAALANPSTTVNGQTCTLGASCTVTAAATSITVGSTTVTSGTSGRILGVAAGPVLSEFTTSGSGTVVALATGAALTTPNIGVATATSVNGMTITSSTGVFTLTNAKTFAVTNTLTLSGTDSTVMTFPSVSATIPRTVASGTKALATSAISSATCTTAQTSTATGTLTTDIVGVTFAADPTATTGYVPLTSGMLTIIFYPTADTINFKVCNNTSATITPGALTLNWRVTR